MSGGSAGVHDPFRNAFVVEVGDLLPKVEVLQQAWTPLACLEGVVGVREPQSLGGGEEFARLGARADTVRFAGGDVCGTDGLRCGTRAFAGRWHGILRVGSTRTG